eukprot:Protomagalhaensia_wolfi_Nauph_80__3348@NODE_3406_length_808_cov_5_607282_g2672_i0_p1_GENE_NODE_3406_length_808_cov_5_607282_g2672_i0NODE_3406_length_808_cov_5_607282_g2672_i0_p1_ORF_typecomplete_len111_score4_60_NODE_3406_length_808_cov_5_607282_g2672_i0403735
MCVSRVRRLDCSIFREIIRDYAHESLVAEIDRLPVEELLSKLAKALFPQSMYLTELELEMFSGKRCATVREARIHMGFVFNRYARLHKRHAHGSIWTDAVVLNITACWRY